MRRECLDFGLTLLGLILGERHLRKIMKQYQTYFNHARPVLAKNKHPFENASLKMDNTFRLFDLNRRDPL